MLRNTYFLVSYDVMVDYIYTKKSHKIPNNENMFKISLKWFLIFIKFIVFIKHYDSIWLEYFVSHVKSLIIIILWKSFFRAIYNNLNMWKTFIFKWKKRRNVRWTIFKIFFWSGFWFKIYYIIKYYYITLTLTHTKVSYYLNFGSMCHSKSKYKNQTKKSETQN
jgi:hypothetical protein